MGCTYMSTINKFHVYNHPHMYLVFEHAYVNRAGVSVDAKAHKPLFTRKELAEKKRDHLRTKSNGDCGYLCVLKLPIKGHKPRILAQILNRQFPTIYLY